MKEIWKDVDGYEEYFMVSDQGNIYSKRTNKVLKTTLSKTGYKIFSTRIGGRLGKAVCFKIHRLVAIAFLDKPEQYHKEFAKDSFYNVVYVNHIDGNKLNNHASNLEWCTGQENVNHAYQSGLITTGPSPLRKLTDEDIEFIRESYIPRCKIYGCRALAKMFCVPHSKISRIISMKAYKTRANSSVVER